MLSCGFYTYKFSFNSHCQFSKVITPIYTPITCMGVLVLALLILGCLFFLLDLEGFLHISDARLFRVYVLQIPSSTLCHFTLLIACFGEQKTLISVIFNLSIFSLTVVLFVLCSRKLGLPISKDDVLLGLFSRNFITLAFTCHSSSHLEMIFLCDMR